MTARWREFVEDDNGRGSSTRLCMVYGIVVGSFVVTWLAVRGTLGGEVFATFMLASGGEYGFGKWRESVERVERTKADAPQPAVLPVPIPPAGPTTLINVSGQSGEQAQDVNIQAEGDVNVRKL